MTTFDEVVREVRSTLNGYGLEREPVAFLTAGINASVTAIVVDDASAFAPGVIEIDSECIYVRSVDVGTNTLTVAPDGRGWDGTTAATHAINARARMNPSYPTWRVQRAVNDTILGVWPDLYGVGTDSFTFTPSITTYEVPAEAESVLKVTASTIGPSQDQPEINHFSFNSNAADFASGNALTLNMVPDPGQTVTVTYSKSPTELTSGDDFTESGLRESARRCILYGAVAQLVSFIDSRRLGTESATADEYDSSQRVGTATQMAAQLTARYQMELEQERRRLRQAHPSRVRFSRP